jgi:hypothetical protein
MQFSTMLFITTGALIKIFLFFVVGGVILGYVVFVNLVKILRLFQLRSNELVYGLSANFTLLYLFILWEQGIIEYPALLNMCSFAGLCLSARALAGSVNKDGAIRTVPIPVLLLRLLGGAALGLTSGYLLLSLYRFAFPAG